MEYIYIYIYTYFYIRIHTYRRTDIHTYIHTHTSKTGGYLPVLSQRPRLRHRSLGPCHSQHADPPRAAGSHGGAIEVTGTTAAAGVSSAGCLGEVVPQSF